MKKTLKSIIALLTVLFIIGAVSVTAFAAEAPAKTTIENSAEAVQTAEGSTTNTKAIAAAIIISIVAAVGAVAMAIAIKSASDGMSRQPEASDGIRSSTMLGLVFIETAIIYGLIVAILIIFVL